MTKASKFTASYIYNILCAFYKWKLILACNIKTKIPKTYLQSGENLKSNVLSQNKNGEQIQLPGIKLRHKQYNTPAALYSDVMMHNAVVEQCSSDGRRRKNADKLK